MINEAMFRRGQGLSKIARSTRPC